MKKPIAWILLLSVLLTGCMAAGAETAVRTVDLSGLYYPSLNTNVNMISARADRKSPYAVYDTEGNPVTTEPYTDISNNEYGFTVRMGDEINTKGFVTASGAQLVPCGYADVNAYSVKWQAGVHVTEATSDNYDYSTYGSEKKFYLTDYVDIYFCGNVVGTLERNQYDNSCSAFGDYLYVRDRDGKWHFYNSAFAESGYDSGSGYGEYDSVYAKRKHNFYHKGSGQQAFAAGCTLTADEVSESIMEDDGVILDLQGNEIAALQYASIYSFTGDYARVRNKQGSYGLINAKGEELLPCVYDSLDYNGPVNGYISAVKDGKQGFVRIEDGSETCFVYPESAVTVRYDFASVTDIDGTVIVETAGAGEMPEHDKDVRFSYSASPVGVAQKADGSCGVIGLFGEVIVPFSSEYDATYDLDVSKDGSVVLGSDGKLYIIDYDFTPPADAAGGETSWVCPVCGYINAPDFNFCPKDATPRP